jgi:hypothetical protein
MNGVMAAMAVAGGVFPSALGARQCEKAAVEAVAEEPALEEARR